METNSETSLEDNCNGILFRDMCMTLEATEQEKSTAKKLAVLFSNRLKEVVKGQSIYPFVRLLLPLHDNERKHYGLKQTAVAKAYVKALQLNETSIDAQRILCWKDKAKHSVALNSLNGATDFSSILEDILKSRITEEMSCFTIGDINTLLDQLSNSYGEEGKIAFFRDRILTKFSAREQKWLMRIIFDDLKLGVTLSSILNYISPTALKTFNKNSNLRFVCEGGSGGVTIFNSFLPMLAYSFKNSGQIVEAERAMKGHPFVLDVKLDGERMLCHVNNSAVKLFSRNTNEYTDKNGKLGRELIGKLQHFNSYILDGEVLSWDVAERKFLGFGSNRGVAKSENKESIEETSKNLVYVIFDLIFASGIEANSIVKRHIRDYKLRFNGYRVPLVDESLVGFKGDMTQLPLAIRRSILAESLITVPNRIIFIEHMTVLATQIEDRKHSIEEFYSRMIDTRQEGLIIKDLTSQYIFGEESRNKSAPWVKIKPGTKTIVS